MNLNNLNKSILTGVISLFSLYSAHSFASSCNEDYKQMDEQIYSQNTITIPKGKYAKRLIPTLNGAVEDIGNNKCQAKATIYEFGVVKIQWQKGNWGNTLEAFNQ